MEPAPLSLPWGEFATLALSTGFLATLTTLIASGLTQRWRSNKLAERDARYLATRIAVIMEQFAIECVDGIEENHLHRSSEGHAGRAHMTLPKLNTLPSEANWTVLEPVLLSRSLSFSNELRLAESTIAFWFDVQPDPVEIQNAFDEQAGACGYRAWQLARDLRTKYELPDFAPSGFSRDPIERLKDRHDRALARIGAED